MKKTQKPLTKPAIEVGNYQISQHFLTKIKFFELFYICQKPTF